MAPTEESKNSIKKYIIDWLECLRRYPMETKIKDYVIGYLPMDYIAYGADGTTLNGILELRRVGFKGNEQIAASIAELYTDGKIRVIAGSDVDMTNPDNIKTALDRLEARLANSSIRIDQDYKLRLYDPTSVIGQCTTRGSYLKKMLKRTNNN